MEEQEVQQVYDELKKQGMSAEDIAVQLASAYQSGQIDKDTFRALMESDGYDVKDESGFDQLPQSAGDDEDGKGDEGGDDLPPADGKAQNDDTDRPDEGGEDGEEEEEGDSDERAKAMRLYGLKDD